MIRALYVLLALQDLQILLVHQIPLDLQDLLFPQHWYLKICLKACFCGLKFEV